MDISISYDSYISPIQNIDKEKIKNLDKKKLKEASQGLEAEFLKVFLKQSKKLMFDNQNKENKAPGKDIMTDFRSVQNDCKRHRKKVFTTKQ